ncbi:TrbC/VirB2 family protein [Microbacterium sp. KUDC0406]|uniref:TrbC/VirB2 family protein n=1 Tax=Microbacterium sp. KUDC0406 TaxID=2909588 RepID=UPI001F1C7664|nr:TrbC/VirB2 family protein [Microbacterium sp. KUDC0406]UJP10358.1 TrbC/VirB2 family protein [Microbacterium sp. KUDC0406]
MTSYPALGFDPAPGDLSLLGAFVDNLSAGADGVEDALSALDGGEDASWSGLAADAFRANQSEDFRPRLVDSGRALRSSHRTLAGWADELAEFQRQARGLEQEAATAKAAVARTQGDRNDAKTASTDEDADPSDLADAERALGLAQGDLTAVIEAAHRLLERVDERAREVAEQLEDAQDLISQYSGNFFSNLWDDAVDLADKFMEYVVPILEDILRAALPIISLLSFVFPALAPIALGISIALVVIDGLQALTGRGSWGDFAIGVAGLALGFAASGLGGVLGNGASTLRINIPTIGPSLATAGGGAATGGIVTVASLSISTGAIVGNTYWAATTANDIYSGGKDLIESVGGPWSNLVERGQNLVAGNGPRTDEELRG